MAAVHHPVLLDRQSRRRHQVGRRVIDYQGGHSLVLSREAAKLHLIGGRVHPDRAAGRLDAGDGVIEARRGEIGSHALPPAAQEHHVGLDAHGGKEGRQQGRFIFAVAVPLAHHLLPLGGHVGAHPERRALVLDLARHVGDQGVELLLIRLRVLSQLCRPGADRRVGDAPRVGEIAIPVDDRPP